MSSTSTFDKPVSPRASLASSTLAPSILFLGVSGCPSSGKSTLAYILALIYPHTILLHGDDFAKPSDEGVPLLPSPLDCPDSDSVSAYDFPRLYTTLDSIKDTGALPPTYSSWYQTNIQSLPAGEQAATRKIGPESLGRHRELLAEHIGITAPELNPTNTSLPKLVILDGFLLFQDPAIRSRLDRKLFLRTSKATAKTRRLSKPGWGPDANPDMYWATEAYFDASVWVNYVKENGWLFEGGNVEGGPDFAVAKREDIFMSRQIDWGVQETGRWAVGIVGRKVQNMLIVSASEVGAKRGSKAS